MAEQGLELERFYQQQTSILYQSRGVVFPGLSVRLNKQLAPGAYRVLVREQPCGGGHIDPAQSLVALPASTLAALGIQAIGSGQDPVDLRPASWIQVTDPIRLALQRLNAKVLSASEYLALCAVGAALQQIDELFGLDEIKGAVASLRDHHRPLVEEVFDGNLLSHAEFTEIIRRLVRERVGVRDLKLILEGVAEFAATHPAPSDRQEWLAELHSFIRIILARGIVSDAGAGRDALRVFVLSAQTEDEFRSALGMWDQGRTHPPLEPEFESAIRANALKLFNPVFDRGALPVVLLCASDIRPLVQEFFGRLFENREWIRTLAFQELPSRSQPQSIGML